MTLSGDCDDREESLRWFPKGEVMKGGKQGDKVDFSSGTAVWVKTAVSLICKNRTFWKLWMFIFIFLINPNKIEEEYEEKRFLWTDAVAGRG